MSMNKIIKEGIESGDIDRNFMIEITQEHPKGECELQYFTITCPECNDTTKWLAFGSDYKCVKCGKWRYWYFKGWVKEGENPFNQSSR